MMLKSSPDGLTANRPVHAEPKFDLHVHSSYSSDADHSVDEILAMANERGIGVIAITDHDSISGSREAVARGPSYGVQVVPAVEVTAFHAECELHILGFFIDIDNPVIENHLRDSQRLDEVRITEVIRKLNSLGFAVDFTEVKRLSPNATPKTSIVAKAIMTNGRNRKDWRVQRYLAASASESPYHNFFLDYLRPGGPAYVVPLAPFPAERAIGVIVQAGGAPVLAHPCSSIRSVRRCQIIEQLKSRGLKGLEVYSNYHSEEEEAEMFSLCERDGLIPTGGSDFHGLTVKPSIEIGNHNCRDLDIVDKLKAQCRPGWPNPIPERRF